MLGVNSGVVVLHDSEAVRYQLNFACTPALTIVEIYSWHYWVINPDQAVTDAKMSPPDPVLTIQQKAASLRGRSGDNHEQMRTRSEKPRSAANGANEAQNGTPEDRQGASHDNIV
jgi:hypothetical protein